MRVLVTGGTGFVGSHAAAALVRAGHDVRLLARRPEQVPVTFAPHRVETGDVVRGDVLDEQAVAGAVRGCDAVVHAAAVFSLDRRDAATMTATNERATRTVLGAAVDAGCDPVVHVSSTVALVRHGGTTPDLPLGDLTMPYSLSKIESERRARELQDAGAPVVVVYPGAVFGPLDPYLGEQALRLAWVARGLFPLWPRGGMYSVDVREVAAVVAAVLEPGQGPRRYVMPGAHVSDDAYFGAVARAVGRRRPHLAIPRRLIGPVTAPVAAAQRVLPARWRYPADREGAEYFLRDTSFDDSPARTDLGVEPRPWDETVSDTIAWMVDAGHLPERYRPRRPAGGAGQAVTPKSPGS